MFVSTYYELFWVILVREVNKNNLLGEQFLIFLPKKYGKIINWVGSLQFLSTLTQIMCFSLSLETLRYITFSVAITSKYAMQDFMNRSFKVCLYCSTNLDVDKFQDSTEVLPILGVLKWGFSPWS